MATVVLRRYRVRQEVMMTSMRIRMKRKRRAGFTLVEVALAVVVVAIGVTAAFALIAAGLSASAKAVAETRASIFADNVFNALRSASAAACNEGMLYDDTPMSSGYFESYWEDFLDSDGAKVTVAGGPAWPVGISFPGGPWAPPSTNFMRVTLDSDIHVAVFTNVSLRTSEETAFVNHAIRYQGIVEESVISDSWASAGDWTNKMKVILNVWEGEFGSDEVDDALVFYTEFINHGKLIPALRE